MSRCYAFYELENALNSGDIEWANKIAARPSNPRMRNIDMSCYFTKALARQDVKVINWILNYHPSYITERKNEIDYYLD